MTMPMPNKEDEDFGVDLEPQSTEQIDDKDFGIDMDQYNGSEEDQEATAWDYAKDIIIQPVLGGLKAFSWPLDVLKAGMVGEALTDIDEIEEAFKKEGKDFDRNKYIRTVMDQAKFIPTQDLLEDVASKASGIDFEPKTKPGRFLNRLFFLRQLLSGKGLSKSIQGAATGALTSEVLKAGGVNETAADITGDVISGGVGSLTKEPRTVSEQAKRFQQLGEKHGLPLMESMLRDDLSYSAKISQKRKAALDEKLGMSSKEAIDKVIEGKLPIAKAKAKGVDLEAFEDFAYEEATNLARSNPIKLDTKPLVKEIDAEIARIKSLAPSPSSAQQQAINILDNERKILSKAKPNTEQLINQRQNYNKEVKNIYKKGEFTPVEDEVKNAYGFLNGAIDRTIETQSGKNVADTYKVARDIYAQNAKLARTEGLINEAFKDGYSAKKLDKLLNSKKGQKLRQDIGEEGVKDLREIAEFGEKAQQATAQYAKSSKYGHNIKEWGPLAGFLLAKIPGSAGILIAAKPMVDYIRGYILTNPAARTSYKNILKNAANGSFNTMAKDFAKIESQIIDDYGSMEDFFREGLDELEIFDPNED